MSDASAQAAVATIPSARTWRARAPSLLGAVVFVLVAAAALTWAKWLPYTAKLAHVGSTRSWSGKDLLAKAGQAGSAPSVHGAWQFVRAYGSAVWMALVAALLIAAAMQALMPRSWLLAPARRHQGQMRRSLFGGVAALPSLMCTCCTAPLAVTLRREGAPRSVVLAYWIGNPVLNPAVLAFLALVCPWEWVAARIVVGCLLVFGGTALVASVTGERREEPPTLDSSTDFELRGAPARFVRSLLRLGGTLLPEYLLVLFAIGLFRGWLFPLGASASHSGALALLIAAGLGTLIVIPTAGEIPILQGLAAIGVGAAPIGALLITLPAISLVSMAMVVRALSPRVTLAMAAVVVVSGVLSGLLLSILTS